MPNILTSLSNYAALGPDGTHMCLKEGGPMVTKALPDIFTKYITLGKVINK